MWCLQSARDVFCAGQNWRAGKCVQVTCRRRQIQVRARDDDGPGVVGRVIRTRNDRMPCVRRQIIPPDARRRRVADGSEQEQMLLVGGHLNQSKVPSPQRNNCFSSLPDKSASMIQAAVKMAGINKLVRAGPLRVAHGLFLHDLRRAGVGAVSRVQPPDGIPAVFRAADQKLPPFLLNRPFPSSRPVRLHTRPANFATKGDFLPNHLPLK